MKKRPEEPKKHYENIMIFWKFKEFEKLKRISKDDGRKLNFSLGTP